MASNKCSCTSSHELRVLASITIRQKKSNKSAATRIITPHLLMQPHAAMLLPGRSRQRISVSQNSLVWQIKPHSNLFIGYQRQMFPSLCDVSGILIEPFSTAW